MPGNSTENHAMNGNTQALPLKYQFTGRNVPHTEQRLNPRFYRML